MPKTDLHDELKMICRKYVRWFSIALGFLIRVFYCLGAIALLAGAIAVSRGLALVLIFMLIGMIIDYMLTTKHSSVMEVISTIGTCMRQNLPLAMALQTASDNGKTKSDKHLRQISSWLTQGYKLSEAIQRGYSQCPGHIVATIAMAERVDQVPQAVKCIERDLLFKSDERNRVKPISMSYLVCLFCFILVAIGSFCVYVLPRFAEVFADFGVELPADTAFLLNTSRVFGPTIGWAALLLVFIAIPLALQQSFLPRRFDKPRLLSRLGDRLKWNLPLFHWFENNYSLVQTVEMLRLSLNAGTTVDAAIDNTIGLDVNLCFKKRLKRWLNNVQNGSNPAEAARKSGLGNTLSWAFDTNINQGNTITILENLENMYRYNYNYRSAIARYIFWPCLIVLLAILEGFVVVAMFHPLVRLIEHLTDTIV